MTYIVTWNVQDLFGVNAAEELVNELKIYKGG
jgi:hypothetical protein